MNNSDNSSGMIDDATRDAIDDKVEEFLGRNTQPRVDLRDMATWAIAYAQKQSANALAETAGQSFDEELFDEMFSDFDEQMNSYAVALRLAKFAHKRTAAAFTARIEELEAFIKFQGDARMQIQREWCSEMDKATQRFRDERDEARAKVADLLESIETLNNTCKLKQMTIIEAQKNRDAALDRIKDLRAALEAIKHRSIEDGPHEIAFDALAADDAAQAKG